MFHTPRHTDSYVSGYWRSVPTYPYEILDAQDAWLHNHTNSLPETTSWSFGELKT